MREHDGPDQANWHSAMPYRPPHLRSAAQRSRRYVRRLLWLRYHHIARAHRSGGLVRWYHSWTARCIRRILVRDGALPR